jgi:hypothetical protein
MGSLQDRPTQEESAKQIDHNRAQKFHGMESNPFPQHFKLACRVGCEFVRQRDKLRIKRKMTCLAFRNTCSTASSVGGGGIR